MSGLVPPGTTRGHPVGSAHVNGTEWGSSRTNRASKGDPRVRSGSIQGRPPTHMVEPVLALENQYGLNHAKGWRSEEHTSELQSRGHLVCRLLLEKKN